MEMRYGKLAATTVSVLAATALSSGTAFAEPAPDAAAASGIHYTANIRGKSVVLSTDRGSMAVRGQHLEILDGHGNEVAAVPLRYRLDNLDHPITAAITGRTVVLTPDANPAAATTARDVPRASVVPVADALRNIAASYPSADARSADALSTLTQQLTVATLSSTLIGTVVGAGIGCVAGLVVGAAATMPVAWLLGTGPIAGCLGGAVLLAPLSGIGSTLLGGGPLAVASVFQYFQTMNAPIVPPAAPQAGH
jgi:hypothetical protein